MKQNTQKRKIEWRKVATTDRFTLHQSVTDPTLFSVRWKRLDETYGSRRLSSSSIENAIREAPGAAGLEPKQARTHVRLVDAFKDALSQASRGVKATQDWHYTVKKFIKWLAGSYPDCMYWHLLTRQIIREYLATYDGKSDSHRRLSLQPIIQTSGYMMREYGCTHFAEGLRIGAKLKKTPPEVYLADVIAFCDFVKEYNPRIEAGVALQGLAGLQLQEATRLTWDKVNVVKGIVEISGQVKNEYRNRVIPVPDRVLQALRRTASLRPDAAHKAVSFQDHVLLSPKGFSYETWWRNYSKEVTAALESWNPNITWTPKDLRNCLPTFAAIHGVSSDIWEQYLGHVPKSVTARHYVPRLNSVSEGENEALDRQMNVFRLLVVDPLNQTIERGGTANVLNFFELMQNEHPTSSKNTADSGA